MSALNQLDCTKCEGWGCRLCRPPAGEQEDVDLRELDLRIAAAVKEEREAFKTLIRNRMEWLSDRWPAAEAHAVEHELLLLDLSLDARSKA